MSDNVKKIVTDYHNEILQKEPLNTETSIARAFILMTI